VLNREAVRLTADERGGRVLKKKELKPWLEEQWVIPPEKSGAFVAAMEDVLEVYTRPEDPKRPVVCMDETSKQHTRETRLPLHAEAWRLLERLEIHDTPKHGGRPNMA